MDTDSGRGSEPKEPPKPANVSRLHSDDADASDATTNEEWYETERLSGQITGRTPSDLPINRPAFTQNQTPVVLDWRHAEFVPAPTALERLAHSLTRRNRRRRRSLLSAPQKPGAQTRRSRRAMLTGASQAAPAPPAPQQDGPATQEMGNGRPSGPQIALRGAGDQTPQRHKRQSAPHQTDRPRSRTWAPLHNVLLAVAASRPQHSLPRGIAKAKSKTQSLILCSAIPGVRQVTIVLGVVALLVTLGIVLEAPTHPTLTMRHAQLGPSAPGISPGHPSSGTGPRGVSVRAGKKTPARQRPTRSRGSHRTDVRRAAKTVTSSTSASTSQTSQEYQASASPPPANETTASTSQPVTYTPPTSAPTSTTSEPTQPTSTASNPTDSGTNGSGSNETRSTGSGSKSTGGPSGKYATFGPGS
jgi:hypothetical protein